MDVTCPYLHGAAPRTAALWGHRGQHTPQPLSWLAAAKLEVNLTGAPLKTPGHQVPPGGSPPAPAKPPIHLLCQPGQHSPCVQMSSATPWHLLDNVLSVPLYD